MLLLVSVSQLSTLRVSDCGTRHVPAVHVQDGCSFYFEPLIYSILPFRFAALLIGSRIGIMTMVLFFSWKRSFFTETRKISVIVIKWISSSFFLTRQKNCFRFSHITTGNVRSCYHSTGRSGSIITPGF